MIDEYVARYGRRLFGLCMTLCRNRIEAEDLYQETWLKALSHIHQFHEAEDFEPWLTKICVNTYRNILRRLKISPFADFSSDEEKCVLIESVPARETDHTVLYDAVDRLPEKLRVTVILFYFRDMDLAQTAKALRIPVGTVKSRLNHARKLLKEVLQDEGF